MDANSDTILLAHGGGGQLSRDLIREEILSRFGKGPLQGLPDAASLQSPSRELVFSTDSFVVQPLEFQGGNIGHLAVHGTVNDIAVAGGDPRWLSLGLILEEGLSRALLRRVLDAVRSAADDCGVSVVTGDTKVVGHGQCDGMYINTAGIGTRIPGYDLGPERIRPGDVILSSGPLAEHGMAILAARHNLELGKTLCSDTAPVHRLVQAAKTLAPSIRFMRDPTRGGLSAVLNETAEDSTFGILLDEHALPFTPAVRAVSELLGIDPLHVASEGRLLLVCAAEAADPVLAAWRTLPEGQSACRIGVVTSRSGCVVLQTRTGGQRLVDLPRGELLPRIC